MNALKRIIGGGTVSYHPALAKALKGSVAAAIFLEQVGFWQDVSERDGGDGWVYRTQKEITDYTALKRDPQETARSLLIKLDVLEEERRGVPARMYYRVKYDNLEVLLQSVDTQQTGVSESNTQASDDPTNSYIERENKRENKRDAEANDDVVHGWHFEEYLREALRDADIPFARGRARRYTGEANKFLKEGIEPDELYEACDRIVERWPEYQLNFEQALRDVRNGGQTNGPKSKDRSFYDKKYGAAEKKRSPKEEQAWEELQKEGQRIVEDLL